MEPAIIISICAIIISFSGLIWQLYIYFDNKRTKLRVFNHYEIIEGKKSTDNVCNIVFTLFNKSTQKKALINSIWIEYILDELLPEKRDNVYNKFYQRKLQFPVLIPPNDVFSFRPDIDWGYSNYLSIDLHAKDKNLMARNGACIYRKCRLIFRDMWGKEYKSKWISVDLKPKDMREYPDTVIIEYDYELDIQE